MSGKSKKDKMAREVGVFMQQYQRKAQRHTEPNDRRYDRKLEERLKRLPPEELGELLSWERRPPEFE
ncbi:hypothetical protein ACQR5V_16785 [Xanthomonas oryzae pv. oryzicola]|uniref:hypothetical protein n=1 Tax=Xanthomonas oryzae TaxID=347 RepID=UPI003249EB82